MGRKAIFCARTEGVLRNPRARSGHTPEGLEIGSGKLIRKLTTVPSSPAQVSSSLQRLWSSLPASVVPCSSHRVVEQDT